MMTQTNKQSRTTPPTTDPAIIAALFECLAAGLGDRDEGGGDGGGGDGDGWDGGEDVGGAGRLVLDAGINSVSIDMNCGGRGIGSERLNQWSST